MKNSTRANAQARQQHTRTESLNERHFAQQIEPLQSCNTTKNQLNMKRRDFKIPKQNMCKSVVLRFLDMLCNSYCS